MNKELIKAIFELDKRRQYIFLMLVNRYPTTIMLKVGQETRRKIFTSRKEYFQLLFDLIQELGFNPLLNFEENLF